MRRRLLLLGLLVSSFTLGFAQTNKDYILTIQKDTIFGTIKMNQDSEAIVFKHRRKKIYFHPKTLQAFGIYNKEEGYKVYKSIKNAVGKHMFVEVLDEGSVKLYKYSRPKEINAYRYSKNLYFIGKSDEKLSTMTPDTYAKTMKVLMKNYPDLLDKLEQISYKEVPVVIALYNQLR